MVDFLSGFSSDLYILDYESKSLSNNMHICARTSQVTLFKHYTNYRNDKRITILEYNFHNLNEVYKIKYNIYNSFE